MTVNRGIGEGTILRHNPTGALWVVVWSAIRCTAVPRTGTAERLQARHIDLDEVEFGPDHEWVVLRAVPPWERTDPDEGCTDDWHIFDGAPTVGDQCRCGTQTFTSWADMAAADTNEVSALDEFIAADSDDARLAMGLDRLREAHAEADRRRLSGWSVEVFEYIEALEHHDGNLNRPL